MFPFRLGVVADDLTGACDLASRTTAAGLATAVHLGAPPDEPDDVACSVVALPIRTAPAREAADAARHAAQRLLALGATRLYQKYCSTFDSTARGNIGPVAEALAEAIGARLTIGTPATPGSGRTVHHGHLFVGGRLVAETSMRDHPLTPMRDSDLVRLLSAQSSGPVALVTERFVRRGVDAVRAEIEHLQRGGAAHVLVDADDERDLDVLADAVAGLHAVLAGAAGFAAALARRGSTAGAPPALPHVPLLGRLILSGSASARTREQVADFPGPVIRVDPTVLAAEGEEPLLDTVERAIAGAGDMPVLVSATADPTAVRTAQEALGRDRSAALIEHALAAVAVRAVGRGDTSHVVVAGGETSGAVATALGVRRLAVGRSVAPGVPWTVATGSGPRLALLLKSGNFGEPDLFRTAWRTAP